jgi:hypothetical protein
MLFRASTGVRFGQQLLDQLPLRVGQIRATAI